MSKRQIFWQNVAAIGKSILAHVNISYDGAKGSLHIDIIPVDPREIVVEEEQKRIEQAPETKAQTLLEQAENSEPANQNNASGDEKSDSSSAKASSTDNGQ